MRIFAICYNTVCQFLRTKLVLAFLFLLLAVVAVVPFWLKGDGTEKGMLQIMLAYSLSALGILLSFFTLFLSTLTFCMDLKDRVIFTIDTKPVRRWEVLLGKWAGVISLDVILLAFLGGAIYIAVLCRAKAFESSETENSAVYEVLAAKAESKPFISRDLDEHESRKSRRKFTWTVPYRAEKKWVFEKITPDSGEKHLTIKFRYYKTGNGGENITGLWTVGAQGKGFYQHMISLPSGSFHGFRVPSSLVSEEGMLNVSFLNMSGPGISAIFPHDDIAVLYRVGGFAMNFFKALLLIFMRLIFISIVGIFSSTFLTLPVASLLTIFILILSLSLPSIEVLLSGRKLNQETMTASGGELAAGFLRKAVVGVLRIFPDLGAYDPVSRITVGAQIKWSHMLKAFTGIFLARSGLAFFLSCFIFNRREVANIGYL